MAFFGHCPQCGRRFHIKLASKKLTHLDREPIRTTVAIPTMGGRGISTAASTPYFVIREGSPIITDIEEFQYAYRCNHCGHEWSENPIEEHKVG